MRRKLIGSLIVPTVLFIVPLLGVAERLAHPGPWLGLACGFVMLASQPAIGPRKMIADSGDRLSALGIFAGVIVPQLLAVLDFGYWRPYDSSLATLPLLAGGSIAVAGLALRLWSISSLGRYFTSTVAVTDGQIVIRSGPYRILRHPSYTGALLTSAGVAVGLSSGLGLALVILLAVPSYLHRIAVEERALTEVLGRDYRSYAAHTWRLVPYLF